MGPSLLGSPRHWSALPARRWAQVIGALRWQGVDTFKRGRSNILKTQSQLRAVLVVREFDALKGSDS